MGQYDQAIACWHRVEMLDGRSIEATTAISRLTQDRLQKPSASARPGRPALAAVSNPSQVSPPLETADAEFTREQAHEEEVHALTETPQRRVEKARQSTKTVHSHEAETFLNDALLSHGNQTELQKPIASVQGECMACDGTFPERQSIEEGIEQAAGSRWLVTALILASGLFLIQSVPTLRSSIIWAVDFRQWSSTGWLLFNGLVILALVAFRHSAGFGTLCGRLWQRPARKLSSGRVN
jgi:hypothetical protein